MRKALLLLAIGLAAGYWWGFNDAQGNSDNIVVRITNQVGGRNRNNLKTNPDGQLDSLERR